MGAGGILILYSVVGGARGVVGVARGVLGVARGVVGGARGVVESAEKVNNVEYANALIKTDQIRNTL